MDALTMNELLLGFSVALSIGVRLAVSEDHLPSSWPLVKRVCVTWGDAVLIALPIAFVFGPKEALLALLPFIPLAVVVLFARQVFDTGNSSPVSAHQAPMQPLDTKRSLDRITYLGATVVPFERKGCNSG